MASDYLLWGIVVHLAADFLFQNEWMAVHKVSLRHPAAYVHAGIHLAGLLLVFPAGAAAGLAVTHLLIDTRAPLSWWRRVFGQTQAGAFALHVAIWGDQTAHIACLALAAALVGKGPLA